MKLTLLTPINKENFNNFENLINRFNEVIEVISNGTDDASIKQQLRNLQLKKIIDDDTSI